jgi:hypothetical protein
MVDDVCCKTGFIPIWKRLKYRGYSVEISVNII